MKRISPPYLFIGLGAGGAVISLAENAFAGRTIADTVGWLTIMVIGIAWADLRGRP